MCDSPIISREMIRQKARNAFLSGKSRDAHNMNPSDALVTWLAEYDRLQAQFPHFDDIRVVLRDFDLAQEGA